VTPQGIAALAERVRRGPDRRPEWLRALPHASEPTALYYRFLLALAEAAAPALAVEIGTYHGTSAAHLAFGAGPGTVLTMDIDLDATAAAAGIASAHGLRNLVAAAADSLSDAARHLMEERPAIDILFIDGLHVREQVLAEYWAWIGHVRPGGIVLFDDIDLDDGMRSAWEEIPPPKILLPILHHTGFGAAIKEGG